MHIDIFNTLQFFDEKPLDSRGHATSIVAVAGARILVRAY